MDRTSTLPVPEHYIPGNLWNLDIPTASTIPGPMGSFMRHVTTMISPNNPSYVTTARWPVDHITQLRTDPTFDHIAAHQAYWEKLQLEQNSLRILVEHDSGSNQIMGEAHQVHDQMVRMVLTMQQRQSAHPWTQEWADRPVPPQAAPLPRHVQPTAQPQPVPVKPAPARHQAQPASLIDEWCANECNAFHHKWVPIHGHKHASDSSLREQCPCLALRSKRSSNSEQAIAVRTPFLALLRDKYSKGGVSCTV